MSILRNIAAGIAARQEKIILWAKKFGTMVTGHSLKQLEEFLFDHILYGVVAYMALEYTGPAYGPIVTWAIMTPLAAFMCRQYIKLYDQSQTDWFGFEALKDAKENIKRAWVRKLLEKSDAFGFIFWSINGDAFMVTTYLRKKENQYDGLTTRDKKIFWGSLLFSNGWWTLRWYVIMWAVYFWEQIQSLALNLCQLTGAC